MVVMLRIDGPGCRHCDTLPQLTHCFFPRYVLLLLFSLNLIAQPPWTAAIQNLDLDGISRLLAQPGAPPWPELSTVPSPLALQIHAKIKQFEGVEPPDVAAIPSRVQLYAALAHRFRTARGYANYVLADTLQTLSILHLTRLVTRSAGGTSECAALLQALDLPLLTPESFQEIYRAKLGPAAKLESETPQQMLATMKRLGDGGDGFMPISADAVSKAGTGALLARANPAGLIYRITITETMGLGALPELIEFLGKGGRLEDINIADIRNYRKLIPGNYTPRFFGVLPVAVDIAQVHQLVEGADNPDFMLLLWALDGPRRPAQNRFHVKEQPLGRLAGFSEALQIEISPSYRRYHVVVRRGSQKVLLTEHSESRPYDDIGAVLYNPQGDRIAYIARRGQQQLVVLDGIESQNYDRIPDGEIHFSPDGRHIGFVGERLGQFFVVTDGRESAALPDVAGLSFSPTQQLAYMVRRNQRWTIEYGNRRSREYAGVNGPAGITFSPDGRSWIYQVTTLQGQSFIILDGARTATLPARDLIDKPVFSADGRRILFRTSSTQPDSVDAQLWDVDHPTRPQTIHASEVFFSRDLRRYATVDRLQAGSVRSYRVTIDGREFEVGGSNVPTVTFSPRGSRFVIGGDQAIIDGAAIPAERRASGFLFSPDEKSCAYAASIRTTADSREVVVRDGNVVQAFRPGIERYPMAFSPDSLHLAYAVPHDPMHWSLAVDGEEAIPTYDAIPFAAKLIFDAPNRFHTVAVRGDSVVRVEVSWDR